MGSAKIIATLWVRWKKPIEPLIELDPEDLEDAQDKEDNAGDKGRLKPSVNGWVWKRRDEKEQACGKK